MEIREDIGSLSTKTYSAGDVIAYSQPFVYALYAEFKGKFCDYCNRENSKLKRCSTCKLMYYCDGNCQKSDWNVHKRECNLFENIRKNCKNTKEWEELKPNILNEMIYLRLTLINQKNTEMGKLKHDLHNGQQRCFDDLIYHENEMKNDDNRKTKLTKLAAFLIKIGVITDSDLEIDLLFQLVGRYQINGIALTDSTNYGIKTICGALSIPLSVFNHSCLPNAIFVNIGTRMEIRAVKRIQPNEEITVSYIDFEKPKLERQLLLRRKYYFECHCVKCDTNSDQNIDYKYSHELFAKYKTECHLFPLNGVICGGESVKIDALKIKYSIRLGEEVLKRKKQMIQYYDYVYSQIMVIHTMWLIASLQYNCAVKSRNEIEKFIELTKHNLNITHGTNHENYKQFEAVLQL